MAEFDAPALAPPWSKFEGVRLADLASDDLRDSTARRVWYPFVWLSSVSFGAAPVA